MNHDLSRRTVVRGVAWSVPVVAVAAPVPVFAASRCGVTGGITVGPNVTTNYRAICSSQSQQATPIPPAIKTVYGDGLLPQYIDVCTCDEITGWYRWRETDTLSDFQIEVDGIHTDQNGPNQGYRPAIFLDINPLGTGGCQRFALTYRTSASRSRTTRQNFSITWTLQRSTSGTAAGPFTDVQSITRAVSIIRTTGTNADDGTNFSSCSPQGRMAIGSAGD